MWPSMRLLPPWLFVEVARDALLQVARLADVEHARRRRRSSGRRRAGCGSAATSASRRSRAAARSSLARKHRPSARPSPTIVPRVHGHCAACGDRSHAARTPRRIALSIIGACSGTSSAGSSTTSATSASRWRLAADLAARGESVRLVDRRCRRAGLDGAAAARRGVEVVGWRRRPRRAPADVVVEAFGCEPPPASSRRWRGARAAPVLDQPRVPQRRALRRALRTACPRRRSRPGAPASTKWFFYPGFTRAHRRPAARAGLLERRRSFGCGDAWLASHRASRRAPDERRVSLFCYRNDAVARAARRARGRADPAAARAAARPREQVGAALGPALRRGALRALRLPLLSASRLRPPAVGVRPQFRARRGFVRARASGPARRSSGSSTSQDDGAHPPSSTPSSTASSPARRLPWPRRCARCSRAGTALRRRRWRRRCPTPTLRAAWLAALRRAGATACAAQDDLVTRLLRFVEAKR